MTPPRFGWLLPTALVGYVALAVMPTLKGPVVAVPVVVTVGLGWFLRRLGGQFHVPVSDEQRGSLALTLTGASAHLVAACGPGDDALLQFVSGLAMTTAAAGTLLAVTRVSSPKGLAVAHPAARSLDALVVLLVLWSLTLGFLGAGSLAPQLVTSDPPARDTALLFSALGSLLLLTAAVVRLRLSRAAEIGTRDRASAALVLTIAGTLLGGLSGFVRSASLDHVAGLTLSSTALATTLALSHSSVVRVVTAVRGALAVGMFAVPVALGGALYVRDSRTNPVVLVLAVATLSTMAGLLSRRLARPLAPEGSRWLDALDDALVGALHPDPDVALRAVLRALWRAEPGAKIRPEIFRHAPGRLLSVDVAGYASERAADFPLGVFDLAAAEHGHTLRAEVTDAVEVKRPDVRPAATWMRAQQALAVGAILDVDGPLGLLVLPRGKRKAPLSLEEVERVELLCERLSGLLAVTSALARAVSRQTALEQQLTDALGAQGEAALRQSATHSRALERRAAESSAAPLTSTGFGRIARERLERGSALAGERLVRLELPAGADPLPWGASVFLAREAALPDGVMARLVVVDASFEPARSGSYWDASEATSPLARASAGTVLVLCPGTLSVAALERLEAHLETPGGAQVILAGETTRELRIQAAPLHVPTLEDRGEDLAAIALYELTRLSVSLRGEPVGIDRSALRALIDFELLGNDAELRGILARALARAGERAEGENISLTDLDLPSGASPAEPGTTESSSLGTTNPERRRAVPTPRSRPPRY